MGVEWCCLRDTRLQRDASYSIAYLDSKSLKLLGKATLQYRVQSIRAKQSKFRCAGDVEVRLLQRFPSARTHTIRGKLKNARSSLNQL